MHPRRRCIQEELFLLQCLRLVMSSRKICEQAGQGQGGSKMNRFSAPSANKDLWIQFSRHAIHMSLPTDYRNQLECKWKPNHNKFVHIRLAVIMRKASLRCIMHRANRKFFNLQIHMSIAPELFATIRRFIQLFFQRGSRKPP